MTFDPTNPQDRAHVRESLSAWHGWDYRPLAQVLGCEPTREAVTVALDMLDAADRPARPAMSPTDAAAYAWPCPNDCRCQVCVCLADEDAARADERRGA